MDKQEYRDKTQQMLKYVENKEYSKAMNIADVIDWHRVKNPGMLSKVSEIYEKNGENQKSRDILFIANDRAPGSRKIVYRLGTLAVKLGDLQEARACYEEFVAISPNDPNKYILKYKILRSQEAPVEMKIEALDDFKRMEYTGKWVYELARIYHNAGMVEECVKECDELISRLKEGKYVIEALELKQQHEKLTEEQDKLYKEYLGLEEEEEDEEDLEIPELEEEEEEEATDVPECIEHILQDWGEVRKEMKKEIKEKKIQAKAEKAAKRKEEKGKEDPSKAILPEDVQQLLDELQNNENEKIKVIQEPIEVPEEKEEPEVVEAEKEEPAEEKEEVKKEVEEKKPEKEGIFAEDDDIIEKDFELTKPLPVIEEEEEEIPVVEKPTFVELQQEINGTVETPEEGKVSMDTGFVVQGRYDLAAQSEIGLKAGLTEEQKKLFSYFVPVRGMSEQIVEVLENDKNCKTRYGTSRTGNILVIGRPGTGKTVLAVNVVKAIQKARKLKQGKVAIVTGDALNKKEVSTILEKLKGGALIIEKAAKMNMFTVRALNDVMERKTGELLVVLEEQRKPLEEMLDSNLDFKQKFTSTLELPIFINDELVTFGQTYAKENDYRIDEMGILALYSRIDVLQQEDHAVTVAEVKEMIDEAIENSKKTNMKRRLRKMFTKTTDNADRIILTEEDFK